MAENLSVNKIQGAIEVAPGEGKTSLSIVGDKLNNTSLLKELSNIRQLERWLRIFQ